MRLVGARRKELERAGGIAGYFGLRFIGRFWLYRKGYMSYKSLWAVGRAGTDLPPFPANEWSLRLGRCGVPLLLLIVFGSATIYIVRAVLSVNAELKLTHFNDNRRSKIDPPWAPFSIKLMPFSWPSDRPSVYL
jgi:hypothetical protein